MPEKATDAKADEWFSKECWLELFGESIKECPELAERIMVLMISLRHMILGDRSERNAAAHAVNNCIKACAPFTRTQLLAEEMEEERRRRQRDHSNQDS